MYAFATQASVLSENPRSSRIDGSATPTIVTSRTIIRFPRHTTTSASHRFLLIIPTPLWLSVNQESERVGRSRHAIPSCRALHVGRFMSGRRGPLRPVHDRSHERTDP